MPKLNLDNSQLLRSIWTGRGTFATPLLVLFVDAYGTEGLTWSPETIHMELEDDFKVKLPQSSFDRLMTGIALLVTDDFYHSLPDFIQFCNTLSGDSVDPRHWDPAEALEIAWGITEAMLISPPDPEDDDPFTDEIRAYMGAVLDDEGIMSPPDILKLALRDDDDITGRVQADFADDPVMFTAIYDFELGKTQEINDGVRRGLALLSQQLGALPLENGSTEDVLKKMFTPSK